MKILKCFAFSVWLAVVVAASTGYPNEITNIHLENATQTGFDIVWTTVHASTSQALLARDTNYEPERWIPVIPDPSLVTTHRVHVDGLVPYNSANGQGQYYGYVVSVDSHGIMSTSPGPQDGTGQHPLMSMRTIPTNTSGAPNMLVYTLGPKDEAYTGYDMYFAVKAALVSGPVANLYIQNQGGYNDGTDGIVKYAGGGAAIGSPQLIHPHFSCLWSNASGLDSAEQVFSSSQHMGYCPNGNDDAAGDFSMRLRVDPNCAPGNYTVTFTVIQNGQSFTTTYPFTVLKTPTAVAKQTPLIPLPLDTSTWATQQGVLGLKWSQYVDLQNAAGNFDVYWGVQSGTWFYDGGRVFEQIDDYQASIGHPNHALWQHAAQAILNPYAGYQVLTSGDMQGYSNFTGGMAMNYMRTHDPMMLNAVNALATGPQSVSVGTVDPWGMREAAYRVNMWVFNTYLGKPASVLLQRNVDKLLGMLNMAKNETPGDLSTSIHPFMDGLAIDALANYWDYSVSIGRPDYRIVPVVKAALDKIWADKWIASTNFLSYNRDTLPLSLSIANTALNNLNSDGYAWVWNQTGDLPSQSRGTQLFQHAWDSPPDYSWSGKVFSQELELSFNTVCHLTNINCKATVLPSQNPYSGSWAQTNPPAIFRTNCDPGTYGSCKPGSIGRTSAMIFWNTLAPASGQVFYGTTASYGSQSSLATPLVGYHSVALLGLQPGTQYHFQVVSCDQYGNCARMHDLTFTTAN